MVTTALDNSATDEIVVIGTDNSGMAKEDVAAGRSGRFGKADDSESTIPDRFGNDSPSDTDDVAAAAASVAVVEETTFSIGVEDATFAAALPATS